jgi:hypothetical protein
MTDFTEAITNDKRISSCTNYEGIYSYILREREALELFLVSSTQMINLLT